MIKKSEYLTTRIIHTLTIADERNDTASASLPSDPPETPQVSFTIQSSDIPVFTPEIENFISCAYIYIVCNNTTGAPESVTFTVNKNGELFLTQTKSISDNSNGSFTIYAYDVAIDDYFDFYLSSTNTSVTYVHSGIMLAPTRWEFTPNTVLKNIIFKDYIISPAFSGQSNYGSYQIWAIGEVEFYFNSYTIATGDFSPGSWWSAENKWIFKLNYGDSANKDSYTFWTNVADPYVSANIIPTTIEYDKVLTTKGD